MIHHAQSGETSLPATVTRQPWICPRCERVNAPHVDQCNCSQSSSAPVTEKPGEPSAEEAVDTFFNSATPHCWVEAFFRNNPSASDTSVVCYCPKCWPGTRHG